MKGEERSKAPEMSDLWIDIGAANKEEAQELVPLGSIATRAHELERLRGDLIVSRATDNKASVLSIIEALRLLSEQRDQLKAAVYVVPSVQEEIGGSGAALAAYAIDPQVALIVDVTFTSDHPQTNPQEIGDIKLGGGPAILTGAYISPRVYQLLHKTAKQADMKVQFEASPSHTGTDNDSVRLARAGVATGVVSIPNRYMHTSSEVVSLNDIEKTADLMAKFVLALDKDTNLIP
jgi:endoglucanase